MTITRFAPSPTGLLHIGGVRTAIFNYLHARSKGGKFLLRIEDTDKSRSTQESIDCILNGMQWMGLHHDGDIVFQSHNAKRHQEVAQELIKNGNAYCCFSSPEEVEKEKEVAKKNCIAYRSKWRNKQNDSHPNIKPVVRLKAPDNDISFQDTVRGDVTIKSEQIDDFIILRSDESPTYMLSVVVDDRDMKITNVIRGDDHLSNTAKQITIYNAMKWDIPMFSHIPLIHGADGTKLSKRHGALSIEEYKNMGFLPEAMRNYLLRLGWSHGDDEIINDQQAIEWFDVKNIGKSPSCFDINKLEFINNHYIRQKDNAELFHMLSPHITHDVLEKNKNFMINGMDLLKERANRLEDIATVGKFYLENPPIQMDEESKSAMKKFGNDILPLIIEELKKINENDWNKENIKKALNATLEKISDPEYKNMKFIYKTLRAKITGTMQSPSIMDVMINLKHNTIEYLEI